MDSVTVELLFTHFGMQKKEFYQKFDSYFHQTPGEYIRKKGKKKPSVFLNPTRILISPL